jgi:endoglucanase
MNRAWFLAAAAACAVPACIPNAIPATAADIAAAKSKCPADGMIDDCEDNNNQVMANKGRSGYWYTFADKTTKIEPAGGGTFTMSAGGANGSAHAAHFSGKIGTAQIVYGGAGFNFVDPKGAYDATAYKGISFWAKIGPGSTSKVRLKVPDSNTDPDGKVCTECFNDFGVDLDLTPTWTQYQIAFGEMKQMEGWGAPHTGAINAKKLYGVQWQANAPGAPFDVWIDDVEFIGCK